MYFNTLKFIKLNKKFDVELKNLNQNLKNNFEN